MLHKSIHPNNLPQREEGATKSIIDRQVITTTRERDREETAQADFSCSIAGEKE